MRRVLSEDHHLHLHSGPPASLLRRLFAAAGTDTEPGFTFLVAGSQLSRLPVNYTTATSRNASRSVNYAALLLPHNPSGFSHRAGQ